MTLEFTIALAVLGAFVAFSVVVLIIRALGRDEDAHEDCTSEGFDRKGSAVTEMRRGEHVARFE